MKKPEMFTAATDCAAPWWKKLTYGFAAFGVAFIMYLGVSILHRIYLSPWCIEHMPKFAEDYGCSPSSFPPMFGLLMLFGLIASAMLLYKAFTTHLRKE